MVLCVVCLTNSNSSSKNTSFHRFPAEDEVRKEWIEFCKIELKNPNFNPNESSRICNAHFLSSDFVKKGTLTSGVIPSIYTEHQSQNQNNDEEIEMDWESNEESREKSTQTENVIPESPVIFFTAKNIKSDATNLNYYTGFKNNKVFDALYNFFCPAVLQLPLIKNLSEEVTPDPSNQNLKPGRKPKLIEEDQFLMVMMRLRLNLPEKVLGDIFSLSISTVSRTINKWIIVMSQMLQMTEIWPSREVLAENLPQKFQNYPDLRVIIDCTEIEIEHASSTIVQKDTWSSYKNRNTVKGLVGISANGQVTFVSKLYGGRVSDKKIVNDSKILEKCEKGDLVMADRGFTIKDECEKKGLKLIIPSFLSGQQQFTNEQVQNSREIAKLRFEVERVIGKSKNFKILQHKIPLNMSKTAEDLWIICNHLANFTSKVQNNEEEEEENNVISIPRVLNDDGNELQTLKRIKWPRSLSTDFLSSAKSNTDKNIETLGLILAKNDSDCFVVTDLVIPKQLGTSDSCEAQEEEADLIQFQNNGKVLVGWIHTHPSQTCFFSSLDLHTQYSFQRGLREFVGVVCSPKYDENRIFRVTEPYGIQYISGCPITGHLHDHPDQEEILFTIANHIIMENDLQFQVHDWRE